MNSNEDILGRAMKIIDHEDQIESDAELYSFLQNSNTDNFSHHNQNDFEDLLKLSTIQPEGSLESLSSSPACFENNSGDYTDQFDENLYGNSYAFPDISFNQDSSVYLNNFPVGTQESLYDSRSQKPCMVEGFKTVRFFFEFNVKIFLNNLI